MRSHRKRWTVLSGTLLCLLAVGFSDTAAAQTVTITSGGQPLSGPMQFSVTAGSVSAAQVLSVTTPPNNGNTITVQIPNAYPWLKVNPSVIPSTPGQLSVSVDATTLVAGTQTGTFTVQILNNPASAQTVTVNATIISSSALSASPASLNFLAQAGASFGTPQNCAVQNSASTCQVTILSNAGPLSYNVITTPANSWLQVDQFTGSTNGIPLNVGVNASALASGSYSGQILIQSKTTNDSVTIAVSLTVSPNATLSASPTQLNFYYTTGNANPPLQLVTVTSSGDPVAFSVTQSANASWLHVTPINSSASSSAPATLQVSVTPNSPAVLAPGPYSATLTIGNATVNVSLVVSNNPFLTVSSPQFAFNAQFGGSSPPVQGLTVGSTGTALNFNVTATSDAGWLTASELGGTTGMPSAVVTLGVSQAVLNTLQIGQYTGMVTVTPANGDAYSIKVPVTLTVGASSQLLAAPSSLAFSYQIGQVQPPAQTVELFASGPDTGFTITTAVAGTPASCGSANWLSAVAQTTPLITPNVLIINVNTSGMTAGTCNGTVKVSYNGTSGATELDIPVTLFVSTSPLLTISLPAGFGLVSTPVQTNPGSGVLQQQIAVASTDGATPLSYSVDFQSAPCGWLSAGPSTGGRNGTTPTSIQVQITPGCVATPGVYPGSVTITSTAGLPAPVTFNISLIVTSNVSVSVTPQGLTFNESQGGPAPAPQSLNFTVSGGNANFVSTVQSDFGWLSLNPSSGNTSLGSISAVVGANTLPQGKYNGIITLSFQNAETPSATIRVQLIVGPAQTLTASASSLTFGYQVGGSAPAAQQLILTSTGGAAAFTIGTTSSGGWLSVDNATGTTGSTGKATVNVSVDPSKIPAGAQAGTQLQGSLSITAPGVLANPIMIGVTLNVTAAPPPAIATVSTSAINNGFGAIAPGELIAIKGNNLGPASCAAPAACSNGGYIFTVNADNTVSSTLGGVQVTFDGFPGTPTYVSATQINVVVPWEIAGRTTTNIVVSYNSVASAALMQQVTSVAPGIYTSDSTGSGQAAAVNLTGANAGTINGTTGSNKPATQGSYVALFMTGGGLTNPGSVTGSVNPAGPLPLKASVTAMIGGQPATVQYSGAAPTLINGVVQINLLVPTGVSGNNVPVVVTIGGQQSQTATIAVQ